MKEKVHGKWHLQGLRPYAPVEDCRDITNYYVTDKIPATVPGGVHLDLYNAGIIENPYVNRNSLNCEWVEKRWWLYETEISFDAAKGKRRYLRFDGLDYACDVYIDNRLCGFHENMFTPLRIDITDIANESFNLKVMFRGVPDELGQFGSTSETGTQKSRFGYGWDFGTHLVNIGIWKDVFVEYVGDVEINSPYITTDVVDCRGIVNIAASFEGKCGNCVSFELISPTGETVGEKSVPFAPGISERFELENPKLWYPNGMGAHPLYTVRISCDEEIYECKVGIRRIEYGRVPGAGEEALPYAVRVNGREMYIKGFNKVPLDHLYGNVDTPTYEWYVKCIAGANANLVRVWGGGIIETEEFYSLCDEYGIFVWQDFIQSSSDIDHIPSKKPEFLKKLYDASEYAVKSLRNHTSLLFWCGGNELTDADEVPVTYEDENIAMLKGITDREDPARLFLPSTSSGPIYRISFTEQNHDAHGPWEYFFRTHYKNYNKLKIMLHAEFGVNGPSSSIPLFLDGRNEAVGCKSDGWHHGEYWWHAARRDDEIFGGFSDFKAYVPFGQWAQAEGIRYCVESEMRKAPETCGSMIWQINEPWPNTDCTNHIDYFGNPKMSYYWIKKAFSELGVSCRYDGLCAKDEFSFEVCCEGYEKKSGEATASVYKSDGTSVNTYTIDLASLPVKITEKLEEDSKIYMVRLSYNGIDKEYFFSSNEEHPYESAKSFKKAELQYSFDETERDGAYIRLSARVKNTSGVPAYFVHPEDETLGYAILAEDAYFTLLPGEEKKIALTLRPRLGLFFGKPTEPPKLTFAYLNA